MSVELAFHLAHHLNVFTGQVVGLVGPDFLYGERSFDINLLKHVDAVVAIGELVDGIVAVDNGIEIACSNDIRNGGSERHCGLIAGGEFTSYGC